VKRREEETNALDIPRDGGEETSTESIDRVRRIFQSSSWNSTYTGVSMSWVEAWQKKKTRNLPDYHNKLSFHFWVDLGLGRSNHSSSHWCNADYLFWWIQKKNTSFHCVELENDDSTGWAKKEIGVRVQDNTRKQHLTLFSFRCGSSKKGGVLFLNVCVCVIGLWKPLLSSSRQCENKL